MKQRICSILLLVTILACKADAQVVYIPDSNFKAALLSNYDINTNKDGEIQYSEASAFTGYLDVWGENISDLTGIEAFTGITDLDVSQNNLTSLNLSNNTALTGLSCYSNRLTSIDISRCTLLQVLVCSYNYLQSVDVGSEFSLTYLDCSGNELTSMDLSSNSALTYMNCSLNNQLTSLNIRNFNNHNMPNDGYDPANSIQLGFYAVGDNLLTCIQVDDPAYSTTTWQHKDPWSAFSTNCTSGGCAATFVLTADPGQPHHYIATNNASGVAPIQYDWSWGDGTPDDHIAYPSHTYADSGFYDICLSITDQTDCSSTYCADYFHITRSSNSMFYITVDSSIVTAAQDIYPQMAGFTIHPNPASNQLTINTGVQLQNAHYTVLNIVGQTVLQSYVRSLQSEIDVSALSPGLYFVKLNDEREVWTGRFVKE